MEIAQRKIEEQPIFPFNSFTNPRPLGDGSFGTVTLYDYQLPDGSVEQRAIKLLHESSTKTDFYKEILPLLTIKHDHVLRFYGRTNCAVFRAIVLEYMPGGNLKQVIYHQKTSNNQEPYQYSLKDMLKWSIHSASALEHMHNLTGVDENNQPVNRPYIHRDLKPENMLLDRTYKTLKIADFGLAKEIDCSKNTSCQGPLNYMAPEVLLKKRYNETCDIYSWTLTFWECLTRQKPFDGWILNDLIEEKQKENHLPIVPNASEKFNKIIQSGSNPDRYNRLSMSSWRKLLEILYHHCHFEEKEKQVNSVCVWSGYEFFYCNGLDGFDWNTLDSNLTDFEAELTRFRNTFNFPPV